MLMSLLLAIAAPNATSVFVAPGDPSAKLKGDGTALKFDPACRDYTLDTLAANPSCAERVAKGESAPSFAIAVHTLAQSPQRARDAVNVLEHSLQVSDNPAVHALLGTILGNAERIKPDYREAVRQLEIAAGRGNPDAADLLASLLIAGKGAPRDIPRAIALYEQAAANGVPEAAIRLGKLYLSGRSVPKDEERGHAWLDAAASAGVPQAARLAALARSETKISNIQIIPAAEPSAVRIIRYGTFDNPDIPPNFGFDLAFQKIHDAPFDDAATLARLKSGASDMPTPYLYELARRLASSDPDRALTTYLVARTRMIYDASRCADPAALEALKAWDVLIGPDIQFLFAGGGRPSAAIATSALAEEARMPSSSQPWWVCRSGLKAMSDALKGQSTPLALKPASDWPALRLAARERLAKVSGK